MINELKVILRGFKSDKTLSALKLAGLSLAFCVVIPLVCNVRFHTSFDRFHPDAERIYNVYIDEVYHGTKDIYGELPLAFGAYSRELFPEVDSMVRTKDVADVLISNDDGNSWKEDILWVDPSFKDVFHIEMLAGSKTGFLNRPNEAYISKSLSMKMFGDINSVGETVRIDEESYSIAGIFQDYPSNSHQKFSILVSLNRFTPSDDIYRWDSWEFLTYVKLKKEADRELFESKLQSIVVDYWIPWVENNYTLDYDFNNENSLKLKLLPVSDIHLQGSFISSFEKQSNKSLIYLNLSIAAVLLLIAYFNLVGFAISKGKKQQLQLSIKRYLGVSRHRLMMAFILETLVYTCIAFAISLFLTSFIWKNNPPVLTGISALSTEEYIIPVLTLFIFSLMIAGISGLILGVFFDTISRRSRYHKTKSYSNSSLNRNILVFQMTASIILLTGTLIIFKQLNFMSDYDMGINTENIVIINHGYRVGNHYDAFKTELKKSPLIEAVSCSNSYPFNWMSNSNYIHANTQPPNPYPFQYFQVDSDFRKVFNFEMTAGRWFSDEYSTDKNTIVLNDAAVRKMGLTDPIGEEFYRIADPSDRYSVIGVAKNFNFRSLHHRVEPLLLKPLKAGDWWRYIEIKSNTEDRKELISGIQQAWNSIAGQQYLDYSFLEDQVATLYEKERSIKRSVEFFSLVAILISCFGLLGTVLNTTAERTKEIGIRKVVGASVFEILALITTNFTKWILLANIFAWPIAWYGMSKWLQNFAYRIDLTIWPFLLAGLAALAIALLTVSWQAVRAAMSNPVEALRYE
ncbi:MAG: FtsX-like permease family protein [Candidatus Marinimicrobia bacterium]|nr:FtsX-like permease family protein [Candidatus Neomarinimicrobiota bacterium]